MPIVTAAKLGFYNYVNYKGRARRADFWWWILFTIVSQYLVSAVSSSVGNIFSTILFLPQIMFAIRRMHDVNKSGWWILLPIGNIIFWAQSGDASSNRFGPPAPPTNF
jgi:uncharacterized membrane protein YhaH (DUF805 family)